MALCLDSACNVQAAVVQAAEAKAAEFEASSQFGQLHERQHKQVQPA